MLPGRRKKRKTTETIHGCCKRGHEAPVMILFVHDYFEIRFALHPALHQCSLTAACLSNPRSVSRDPLRILARAKAKLKNRGLCVFPLAVRHLDTTAVGLPFKRSLRRRRINRQVDRQTSTGLSGGGGLKCERHCRLASKPANAKP